MTGALIAGCQSDEGPGETLSEEEVAYARTVGQQAAAALATGLVSELTQALDDRGPEGAVEVCATEALRLTDQIARDAGSGVELKRVSSRNRNPKNAPDELEAVALEYFRQRAEEGEPLPTEWVQSDGEGAARYYKTLFVADFCVQCHGAPEQMAAAVRDILAARYPDDAAVEYAEGDFRGLIRVSVPVGDGR